MEPGAAPPGAEANVGDTVLVKHGLGDATHVIHRVTKKRAYIMWNDIAEGCFDRVVTGWGWLQPIPKRYVWSTTRYYLIPKKVP